MARTPPGKLPTDGSGIDWVQVTTSQRVDRIVDAVVWSTFASAVVGAAVAVWLTIRLRNSYGIAGRLIQGTLVGALSGFAAAAVQAVPQNIVKVTSLADDKHDLLLVAGVAVNGAILGALVGWLWRRRGSAGLAAGLVAGALYELAVVRAQWDGANDRVLKSCLAALVIVGSVAVTQALLDAWAERSPRALASSRGP
jgi:hypothetical protein